MLRQVRHISDLAQVAYVRQKEQLGLGHAVLMAKELVGHEPFAVILSDDVVIGDRPCIGQLIHAYSQTHSSVVAVMEVPPEETSRYGVIALRADRTTRSTTAGSIASPASSRSRHPADAPSNLAIIGRYVLTPKIFDKLEQTPRGAGGEIQLTDAIEALMAGAGRSTPTSSRAPATTPGTTMGWLKASVELALQRPDLGAEFRAYLRPRALIGADRADRPASRAVRTAMGYAAGRDAARDGGARHARGATLGGDRQRPRRPLSAGRAARRRAAWRPSTAPRTPSSTATSPSSSCAPSTGATRTSRPASARRRRPPPSLNHPNVVTVYDYGEDPSGPFIVMELVDGEDLATILRRSGPLPPRQAARIAAAVARALAAAHARGIVHRDVKPGNVLLGARRPGQGRRLRHRPGDRRGPDDAARHDPRIGPLLQPGAGARRAGDRRRRTSTRWASSCTRCSPAAGRARATAPPRSRLARLAGPVPDPMRRSAPRSRRPSRRSPARRSPPTRSTASRPPTADGRRARGAISARPSPRVRPVRGSRRAGRAAAGRPADRRQAGRRRGRRRAGHDRDRRAPTRRAMPTRRARLRRRRRAARRRRHRRASPSRRSTTTRRGTGPGRLDRRACSRIAILAAIAFLVFQAARPARGARRPVAAGRGPELRRPAFDDADAQATPARPDGSSATPTGRADGPAGRHDPDPGSSPRDRQVDAGSDGQGDRRGRPRQRRRPRPAQDLTRVGRAPDAGRGRPAAPGTRTEAFDPDRPVGSGRSAQSHAPGPIVAKGTTVDYVVSKGPEPTPTPDAHPDPDADADPDADPGPDADADPDARRRPDPDPDPDRRPPTPDARRPSAGRRHDPAGRPASAVELAPQVPARLASGRRRRALVAAGIGTRRLVAGSALAPRRAVARPSCERAAAAAPARRSRPRRTRDRVERSRRRSPAPPVARRPVGRLGRAPATTARASQQDRISSPLSGARRAVEAAVAHVRGDGATEVPTGRAGGAGATADPAAGRLGLWGPAVRASPHRHGADGSCDAPRCRTRRRAARAALLGRS